MRTFLLLLSVLTLALTLTLAHAAPPATKPTTGPSTKGATSKPVTVKEMLESLPADCRPEKGRPWTEGLRKRANEWLNATYRGRVMEFAKAEVIRVFEGEVSIRPPVVRVGRAEVATIVTLALTESDPVATRLVAGDRVSTKFTISLSRQRSPVINFDPDTGVGPSISIYSSDVTSLVRVQGR